MAELERIVIEVSPEDLKKLEDLRDGKTWKELFLPPLGLEAKRIRTDRRKR